jgi:hypothetical protein
MTNLADLEAHQADALTALEALGAQLGWKGQASVLEGNLVYQVPLPTHPDVSGAVFMVEREEPLIRVYLTLPRRISETQRQQAAEFVARAGFGRRFGALELDLDQGRMRVRVETDTTEDTLEESIARVLDRALALGREVSSGWRAIAQSD